MNRVIVSVTEKINEPNWISQVEEFLQKILENQKKDGWELSVLFCDDKFIQQLNKDFREIDSPTDILSFEDAFSIILSCIAFSFGCCALFFILS